MKRVLSVIDEIWPLARPFAISRGTKTAAHVVIAGIESDGLRGRGECVPYAHYGETVEGVCKQIISQRTAVADGMDIAGMNAFLPAGAARNALDAALWDLKAKSSGKRVWEILGMPKPAPAVTTMTIGVGPIDEMAAQAKHLSDAPLIKVKLDNKDVVPRMEAIRASAPASRLIIDPNEGWSVAQLANWAPILQRLGVEMIEQPVPANDDAGLADYDPPVTLCADEACHTAVDLPNLVGKYQMVNIKLDKTGGLSEALHLGHAAKAAGFQIMVGCMVATSLAMAPAVLLGSFAEFLDLDGPLLLKQDRADSLVFEDGKIHPPMEELWG